eukprot:13609856-Alexandrium_andersonii.AAC.1
MDPAQRPLRARRLDPGSRDQDLSAPLGVLGPGLFGGRRRLVGGDDGASRRGPRRSLADRRPPGQSCSSRPRGLGRRPAGWPTRCGPRARGDVGGNLIS